MNLASLMERRTSIRIPTDLPLVARKDGHERHCRAIELTTNGALVHYPASASPPLVQELELQLGDGCSLRTLARTVWSAGRLQAVRFLGLGDVDRLELAEHLDRQLR
jgi:hypothetical protein